MSNYVTTNIRLTEEDYLRLKEEAAKRRMSLAAVVRERVGAKKLSKEVYVEKLLNLKTNWFTNKDYQEYKKIRKDTEKRLRKY